MKCFVAVLGLAAMAAAEPTADAEAGYYRGYGYGLSPYYGHRAYGYGYPAYAGYGYHYGKRSADAEAQPEADAEAGYYGGYYGHRAYGYGLGYYGHRAYGYGYPAYAGYGYHYGKRSADAEPQFLAAPYAYGVAPYTYAPFVRPAVAASHTVVSTPAATYGIHQLHKRDAEAQPEADAEAYYYGGYPSYAYGHRAYGYGAYGYGHRAYGYPYSYGRYYY